MIFFAQFLHFIRRLVLVSTPGFVRAVPEWSSASPFPPLIRGVLSITAIVAATSLVATPGQATSDDKPCVAMGKSWDEDGEYYCGVCEIEDSGTCVAICTNGKGGVFECEGWI